MPKPYIAVNEVRLVNGPESFRRFEIIGPKMCMATANHGGFVGFQNHFPIGVFPMGGRYGGAKLDMRESLNPLPVRQYTFWKDWRDHDQMHVDNFDTIFRLCSGCLDLMIDGPWEPIYEIVSHDLPENIGLTDVPAKLGAAFMAGQAVPSVALPYGQRVVATSDHTIIPGREQDFETAIEQLMQAFKEAPGFLGYMVLRQMGVSAIGSLQLKPAALHQALQTTGDYPPRIKEGNFATPEGKATPAQYVVHMEWADMNTAVMGISRVVINTRFRALHDPVLDTLLKGPYIQLWSPQMEDTSWRQYLHA
ncbi:Sulfur oxygenase/reductase [Candidatus Hydrogenisulfobacillus filiaventi]|uniref:Sulfur oxygenase/reductase n=1 Tax=Candidatus Hydrogenisulfobacillus filiaventi TaxID=2707344 RepID=A0A6F8ZDC7_9FIRM|nr:Sulfur oxygenase/reductase [Candidatus Hydrogenisulfobacillus filiaventi]